MIILIDAYNVLKQNVQGDVSLAMSEQFLAKLALYGRKKKHTLIVVFDGGSFHWPYEDKRKHITVVYSGYRSSADDIIKEIIATRHQNDMLLVSSDRALCLYTEEYNIPSINPEDFMPYVYKHEKTYPAFIKGTGLTRKNESDVNADTQLDELMREGSRMLLLKEETKHVSCQRGGRSKIERRLCKLVEKL